MLKPIDTGTVIRDGGAFGLFPQEIHTGVAWWIAACFVVTTKTNRLVAAHDGNPTSIEFFQLLCWGAINAQHYACTVVTLADAAETMLLDVMHAAGDVPGVRISSAPAALGSTVTIALYDRDGKPLTEATGLAEIRAMIAQDRVPIPVNASSKGRIQPHAQEGEH
jgi:hypothetical protein